jgi:glycine betaine/proline transport system substrate-binding protein
MKESKSFRSFAVAAVAMALLGIGLAGCGGSSSGDGGPSQEMQMVTVNWIEGMAMTYMQEAILEDSLGMEVEVNEVQGGGIAFSSVAQGDADVFNEAWLPTTHQEQWESNRDNLQKLGYTYRGTTVGLAVPTYAEIDTIPDLPNYRDELDGTINGIEAGSAINEQTKQTLETYGLEGDFRVQAASGPANWQAVESAIENKRPIVVTAWYPHWIWNQYDLKYVGGAKTDHNVDIWGGPEAIFTVVENGFLEQFPREAVCFLKEFEAKDEQVFSLMTAFNERGSASKSETARQWIENNPKPVARWMEDTEACAAAEGPEPLPDDATFSASRGD